jgi:hypothetical protein
MPWMGNPASGVVPESMYSTTAERDLIKKAEMTRYTEGRSWIAKMSETDKLLNLKPGSTLRQLYQESHLDPGATGRMTSSGQAQGMAQFMPGTTQKLAARFKQLYGHQPNPRDPIDAILLNRLYMGGLMKQEGGDYDRALAFYNSGKGYADNKETRDYVGAITGHAAPEAKSGSAAGGVTHRVHITSDPVTLVDPAGNQRGSFALKPYSSPVPAGN